MRAVKGGGKGLGLKCVQEFSMDEHGRLSTIRKESNETRDGMGICRCTGKSV